jgi:hypothetical protein
MGHTTYRLKLHYTYPGGATAVTTWPVSYSAREYAEVACAAILLYTLTIGVMNAVRYRETLTHITVHLTTFTEGHITDDTILVERKATP